MGTPCAIRLDFTLCRDASSEITWAVASPSTVVFVARIASDTALPRAKFQLSEAEFIRTDAVERRQMAHQHEVAAGKLPDCSIAATSAGDSTTHSRV